MGLFYAYLEDSERGYHNFIAFIDREAADEWWRMISAPSSPYATKIKRNSPQFYTQNDTSNINVAYFFSDAKLPEAGEFHRKMYFLYCGTNPITISPVTFTDHISGRWWASQRDNLQGVHWSYISDRYFIRSKADPWSHWYLPISGQCLVCGDTTCNAVHVSSEYRTKFCVRVHDLEEGSPSSVMIGRDEISITTRRGYTLHVDDTGDLKATSEYQGDTDLVFDDLKNRFLARAEKQTNGEIWEYFESVEKGSGESWELVD